MNKRLTISVFCCAFLFTTTFGSTKKKCSPDSPNTTCRITPDENLYPELRYYAFSVGAAAWYRSFQPGMANQFLPVEFNVEYGKTKSPFTLMFSANILSTYVLNNFLLKPDYFSLALSWQPFRKEHPSSGWRFKIFAGGNLSYNRYTEHIYPGVVNYTNKVEHQVGAGVHLGTILTYKLKNIEIGPSIEYNTGQADFYAGYFTKQPFNTGSLQVLVCVKYFWVHNENRNKCPAYRKFQKIEL